MCPAPICNAPTCEAFNVQRLVLAAGEAKSRQLELTWDDLVEADLSGQLAKKLRA